MLLDSGIVNPAVEEQAREVLKEIRPAAENVPGLNVELLLETLAFIQAERGLWDQSSYYTRKYLAPECRTSCCFAGWAVAIHEGRDPYDDNSEERRQALHLSGGKDLVPWRAIAYLGINEREAAVLFRASNSLPVIQQAVEAIVEGKYRRDPVPLTPGMTQLDWERHMEDLEATSFYGANISFRY